MSHNIEDVTADNEDSLQTLIRAITLSQGDFSPILVRCNYTHLREQIVEKLREQCPIPIRELVLDESVKTLYTTIEQSLNNEQPNALMVFGLESVENIDRVIVATNQVREEFRKNFPFPIVFWANDEVLKKFIRLAPDFDSWTTSIEFAIATDELIASLNQTADEAFNKILNAGAGKFLDNAVVNIAVGSRNSSDIKSVIADLINRKQVLEPELEANLYFLLGRDAQAIGELEKAREYYEQSLKLWQQHYTNLTPPTSAYQGEISPNRQLIERYGCLLFYLGLWWRRYAVLHRAEYLPACRKARDYFRQCLGVFQQGNRPDLVTKFINPLGEVLSRLEEWNELEDVAKTSVQLHQTYRDSNHLASSGYAYGLLAEVALKRGDGSTAKNYAELALQSNSDPKIVAHVLKYANSDWSWALQQYESLYLLLLAKSQRYLNQQEEAVRNLEKARELSNPQYDPQLYIDILKELRSLYFEAGEYLKAFEVKHEQQSIEAQYGFRPFIGAGSLRPIKRVINPALDPVDPQVRAQERLTASGRRSDVNHLIERLGRNDHQLIVIHGMSGVGKSSLLWAGLVPELKQNPIGDRAALPVTLRYYNNWIRELGKHLVKSLQQMGIEETVFAPTLDPPQPPLKRGEQERKLLISTQEQEFNPLLSSQAQEICNQESPPFQGGLGGSSASVKTIIEQLKKNTERNLLTVLIFDQFEEFFFACTNLVERRHFYEFLKVCLNLPFVKVILSLREDYLHYLLECDRFASLDVINNNILDKNIRYYLGDFSPKRAKSVILELTERSQFYLEPALLDELVRDLAGELGEVRPIELQVVGAQLQTEDITTLEQYHQLGANPKEKLVQRSLEEVIKDCGVENERAARLVLYLLTNENGTRPLKTNDELVADLKVLGFASETNQLALVLEVLVGSGLVFLVPDSPANRYQLVHDYLVAFIRQQQAPGLLAELAEAKEKQKLTEAQLRQALREKEEALRQEQEERKRAEIAEIEALSSLSQVLWLSHNQLGALLAIVKAGKKLQETEVPFEAKTRTLSRLWQVVYSVKERNRFQGHSAGVNSVRFSPDGHTIASASSDHTVKLWRIDGTLLQTFEWHSDGVNSVNFSPDGQTIASVSLDGKVNLWSTDGTLLQTFEGYRNYGLHFSPNGQIIALISGDTVNLWSTDGTLLISLGGHSRWRNSISYSPDGQILALAGREGTVKLWRTDGTLLQTLGGHSSGVNSISFSPDGRMLASAGREGTVKLWHLDGTVVQIFQGHSSGVNSVSFSPDGQMIVSASADNTVKLWGLDSNLVQTFHFDKPIAQIYNVSFSPDEQMIASDGGDTAVKLWGKDDRLLQILRGHSERIYSVSFSSDGQMIASAGSDTVVKLWGKDGRLLQILQGHSERIYSVSFSPDEQIIASASADNTVKLWSKNGTLLQTFQGHRGGATSVSFSPDGQMIASASGNGTVNLWRFDGHLLQTFRGHKNWVSSVSFSPDGQTIASASGDNTVKLWGKDGTLLQTFQGHLGGVTSISFSPDGQRIASASADSTIKLWGKDGTLLQTFQGHRERVYCVSFSPDGQTIGSASGDNTVKLWSLDGTLLQTFQAHQVRSISFSPDGKTIASAGDDDTVKLWRLLSLDDLLICGCNWLQDYLKTNPNVSESDRTLCDGICK